MGFSIGDAVNSAVGAVKGAVNDVAKKLGLKSPFTADGGNKSDLLDAFEKETGGKNWVINGADWYEVYGYQFSIVSVSGSEKAEFKFTLPIPPQSLMIKPVMASRATPTIGGVVEETSGVTFWMIQMSGTTGVAVSRSESDQTKRAEMAKVFRDNISTTGLLSGVSANLNRTISKIGGVADKAIDAFGRVSNAISSGDYAGAIGDAAAGFVGAANTALLPPLPYSESAVNQVSNGFTEAQELQKFFYMYSKVKDKNPNKYSLKFKCYKTNQEWRVIVKDFSLQISAQNPNLYKYSISLQGWDCMPIDGRDKVKPFDRLNPGGDLSSVNTVTSKVLGKTALGKKILGL